MKTEEQTKTEIEFTEKASSRYRDTLEKFKNRLALDPSSTIDLFIIVLGPEQSMLKKLLIKNG